MNLFFKLTLFLSVASIILTALLLQEKVARHEPANQTRQRVPHDESNLCSPLLSNATPQYEVRLDGRRYPQVVPIYLNKSLNFECLNRGPLKRILLWTPFWWSNSYDFEMGVRTPFEKYKCPVTNCMITNDRSSYNCSDVVLFHAFNMLKSNVSHAKRMPRHRPVGQRWVFTYFESPLLVENMCYQGLQNKFALLNTYHSHSDFNSVYYSNAHFEWRINNTFDMHFDYHATKVRAPPRKQSHFRENIFDFLFVLFQ